MMVTKMLTVTARPTRKSLTRLLMSPRTLTVTVSRTLSIVMMRMARRVIRMAMASSMLRTRTLMATVFLMMMRRKLVLIR